VAGIAIATAVAGAILTLIGLCIFLKGKRSSKYPSTLRGDRKEVTTRTVPNHRPAQLRLNELPLSRVDDSKIRTCMQDLNVLIHQHVENHYHNRELHADTPDLVQKLVQCGYPDSAEALAGFLINPRTRRTAIRRLLSAVIYSHIDIENNTGMSLLPGFVSDFTRAIFRAEKDAKDQGKLTSLLSPLHGC
jgi:hypothetical protein